MSILKNLVNPVSNLRREHAPEDYPREVQPHRASVDDRLEIHPIRPRRIAESKLPITTRHERLHAFDEELSLAHHDTRIAVPRTVVVVMTSKTFPLFLRLERLWTSVLLAEVPVRAVIRLRHLLVLAHEPQQIRIQIRMLHDKAIALSLIHISEPTR